MKDYPADCCPEGKENDGNATVSLIRNGAGNAVWEEWCRCGKPIWSPLKPPNSRLCPLAAPKTTTDKSTRMIRLCPFQSCHQNTSQQK
jgi:hypothetical protein